MRESFRQLLHDWRAWLLLVVLLLAANHGLAGFREGIRQQHIILLQQDIAELRQHRCEEPVITNVSRPADIAPSAEGVNLALSPTDVIVTLDSPEEAEKFMAWLVNIGGGDFQARIREEAEPTEETAP